MRDAGERRPSETSDRERAGQPGGVVDRVRASEQTALRIWRVLEAKTDVMLADRDLLLDEQSRTHAEAYRNNIENYIGTVKVPVGMAGPLRIHGEHARGEFHVPLATTEAALVASYQRGMRLITEAGGCTAALLGEGVSRAPAFTFTSVRDSVEFVRWATEALSELRRIAESTTRHGKLIAMHPVIEGNHVYLSFEYTTGDAAGQNMVTIATQAICDHVREHCPVRPRQILVEGNLAGDKKASALAFVSVRGRRVSAEVTLPPALVERRLHLSVHDMTEAWKTLAVGSVLSGTMGIEGHYANALAALFIATGQDAATVSESAMGLTRMEMTDDGSLYASVTLPDLVVGSVGGGSALPAQSACLRMTGCVGPGKAHAFAELCAAVCLAGELSILGALATGEFAHAHQNFARG